MTTQADIQKTATALATARDALAAALRVMQQGMDAVKDHDMPAIKRAARIVAKGHNLLAEQIRDNRDLFKKPRSYVVDGMKYGLQKRPGKMRWSNDAQVVERIKRLAAAGDIAGDQIALLIATQEKPVAKALEGLDARLLKKLGVTVEADCDEVLIKSVDSAVEKQINAIIKDVTKDDNAAVVA